MNSINKKFNNIEDLNSNIFEEILSVMEVNKSSNLILSGGNSPRYLFKMISQNKKYFKEATFLMSDERVVNIDDLNSNEGEFIRLSNISRDNLISLHDEAIAKKLKSRRLILMTNVEGVYDDKKNLISEIKPFDLENLIKWKIVEGGMIPKIENCVDAVENGVRGVVILDGRKPHSILHEIFSEEGSGTLIRK